jgi:hypothetical protein
MKGQQAHIGLRSGGVLVVTKGEGGQPFVDASQVTINDVAAGLVGQNRFANQLHRQPYTVLEHSLLGSYLFDDPALATAYLFHDTAEGFGVCDLNWKIKLMYGAQVKRVEAAILEALAPRFGFAYPLPPQIKEIDRALGAYELISLHPAAARVLEGYGITWEQARTGLSEAHRGTVDRWFFRAPAYLPRQQEMWLERLHVLRGIAHDRKAVEPIFAYLSRPGNLPYHIPLLIAHAARDLDIPTDLVIAELQRLEGQGVLVRRDNYYHLTETPDAVPAAATADAPR